MPRTDQTDAQPDSPDAEALDSSALDTTAEHAAEVGWLLKDLTASPTPYHAVETARSRLVDAGWTEVDLHRTFPDGGGLHFVCSGGLLVAWAAPDGPIDRFTVVGAHTDSPNLRIRTNANVTSAGWSQVGVEIYGGVLLNSWLDRDLGVAGRVTVRGETGPEQRLLLEDRPLLRVPQLAIHLDRAISTEGLKLDPQKHLVPLWAAGEAPGFADWVAGTLGTDVDDILGWDLMTFDVQPPALVGLDGDLLASARIDNLLSSFCGVRALTEVGPGAREVDGGSVPVLALYDHEEIGSTSATGAAGAALVSILERISLAAGLDRAGHLAALARSLVVSADGAHATHPNYADRHEPSHQIAVNAGVVIKRNANQRYATDAISEGRMRALCADAGVPLQTYIHRNDLPCGSTIGPVTAGQLGVPTVDLGAAQLAMHSIRELAGVEDVGHLTRALAAAFANA